MENSINFLGGSVYTYSLIKSKAINSLKQDWNYELILLNLAYGDYSLLARGDRNSSGVPVLLIEIWRGKNLLEFSKIEDIQNTDFLYQEVQQIIYHVVKIANWCPRNFCFFWLGKGDMIPGETSESSDGVSNNYKKINKGRCAENLGPCSRNSRFKKGSIDRNAIDWYEPCEPYLDRERLAHDYFMTAESAESHL